MFAQSGPRFEELEDLFVLFRREIGADTHVHHDYIPLSRAVVAGRSDVMTTDAVVCPKFCAAFASCSGRNFRRLPVAGATDQPGQSRTGNDYDSSGQADPFTNFASIFLHV